MDHPSDEGYWPVRDLEEDQGVARERAPEITACPTSGDELIPTAPAERNPKRVLVLLGIGIGLSLLGDSTLYIVLPDPDIAAQAGVSLAMVGVLLGINRLVRLLFNTPVGALMDRLPRRRLMIISLALGVVSTVIYAAGAGFGTLVLGRILWGAAWSGLWVGSNTMVLDISSEQNRGRLSGQYQMWFFIGIGVSSMLGGMFTDLFGYRGGLWVSAGMSSLGLLLWLIALPETRDDSDLASDPYRDQVPKGASLPFPWKVTVAASVPVFVIRVVFAGAMAATTILWLSQYGLAEIDLRWIALPLASFSGIVIGLRMLASVLGATLAGFLSDRIGGRWAVLSVAMAIGAGGAWMMSSSTLSLAFLGTMLAAIAGGSGQALSPAVAGDRVDRRLRGRVLGVMFSIGDVGSTIGPPLALALIVRMPIGRLYVGCAGLLAIAGLFSAWQWAAHDRPPKPVKSMGIPADREV